jgi:hypothetical protein
MMPTYCCTIPTPAAGDSDSGGDLLAYRDAAITYAASRRRQALLSIEAGPEAWDLLSWLGIEGVETVPASGSITYLDPSRSPAAGVQARALPAWGAWNLSLRWFREQGYVGEAIFAALIRSSYGPEAMDFFPTRSELGFYYDDSLLLSTPARWDQEYLDASQAFFMEELMPAELLEKALQVLPKQPREALERSAGDWMQELHGVTFLLASELRTLLPLSRLLRNLLTPEAPAPRLKELLEGLRVWDRAGWSSAWNAIPEPDRLALSQALCADFSAQAEAVLFTAGPSLLRWRAGLPAEALR